MKNKMVITLLGLLFFVALTSMLREDPLTTLLKKLEEFSTNYPQEKVYLHLDKPYYAVGDEIWFKAYFVDAKTTQPSKHSEVLYVDLVSQNNELEAQLKLPISGGITWGNISLPDTLEEGNYRIRAYTNWMRNASPNFFYDKTLKIGNMWSNKIFTASKSEVLQGEKGQNLSNTVRFFDDDNKPYSNCAVSYQLKQNGKTLSRGRGQTNANGELQIAVQNIKEPLKESAAIVANITLPDKKQYLKTVFLQVAKPTYDVQFMPEGGNMIVNLPCKVGFKALNNLGRGEDISGVITDGDGAEIMEFKSEYLGMGNVTITPLANKTYKAKVKFKDGSSQTFNLPPAQKTGQTISTNNLLPNHQLKIKVLCSEELLNTGDVYLVGQHNGNTYFSTKLSTNKQLAQVSVDKTTFPSGLVQLTLFNTQMQPVAERIIFVNNPLDKIDVDITNLNSTYGEKTAVKAFVTAKNHEKPARGSFSVAITNSRAVKPDPENESNIFTSLLLTSDLSGYVEKPNHYFLKNDEETAAQLDNLLLTQGWRKINWKTIRSNIAPVYAFKPETAIAISGKVTKGGKPVVNGKVTIISNSAGFFMLDTLTDAKGRFNFDKLQFSDSVKFVVQARTDKDKKFVEIEIDKYPGQNVTPNKNTGDVVVNVNDAIFSYLKQSENYFNDLASKGWLNRTVMLDAVTIVGKKNPAPNSQNLNGPGNADQVFTAKDLETSAFSLSQFLQGRIVGTIIRDGQAYSMRNSNSRPMAIFIDGMDMGEGFRLDNIVVPDIESIEILRTISYLTMYGSRGASGIIYITTKRGGSGGISKGPSPGIIAVSPKGFSAIKEFYSPKYETPQENAPDYRSTILWQPQLVTDSAGKAPLNYYNGQPGTYRIVLEGLDLEGNIARKVLTYEVK